jgi:hypothetical protein
VCQSDKSVLGLTVRRPLAAGLGVVVVGRNREVGAELTRRHGASSSGSFKLACPKISGTLAVHAFSRKDHVRASAGLTCRGPLHFTVRIVLRNMMAPRTCQAWSSGDGSNSSPGDDEPGELGDDVTDLRCANHTPFGMSSVDGVQRNKWDDGALA